MDAIVVFKIFSEAAGQNQYSYTDLQMNVRPSFLVVVRGVEVPFESYVLLCGEAQQLNLFDATIRHETIEQADIPQGEPYCVIEPLKVRVERLSPTEFIAKVENANLAIGGATHHDAYRNLVNEVLDAFDFLRENEPNLGDNLRNQLALLRKHLVPVNN